MNQTLLNIINSDECITEKTKHVLKLFFSNMKSILFPRIQILLLDYIEKGYISAEYVYVKCILYFSQYMKEKESTEENIDKNVEETLIENVEKLLIFCIRKLSNMNFYVSISKTQAIHMIIFTITNVLPYSKKDIIDKLIGICISNGLDVLSFVYKTRSESIQIKDFLERKGFLLGTSIKENYAFYLDRSTETGTGTYSKCIKYSCNTILKTKIQKGVRFNATTKKEIETIYKYLDESINELNSEAFIAIFQNLGIGFKQNEAYTYCLINKIIFLLEQYTTLDTQVLERLLSILKVLIIFGNSFDSDQWNRITNLSCNKELMETYYEQYSITLSILLRDFCISAFIKPTTPISDIIAEYLKYTSSLPNSESNTVSNSESNTVYDSPDEIRYKDGTNVYYFLSSNIESLISTGINPYTGLKFPKEYIEGLHMYRTVNRRLGLLKIQYTHDVERSELVSSAYIQSCCQSILQVAKLYSVDIDRIQSLTSEQYIKLCSSIEIKYNINDINMTFPTFCCLIHNEIHDDYKKTQMFYEKLKVSFKL